MSVSPVLVGEVVLLERQLRRCSSLCIYWSLVLRLSRLRYLRTLDASARGVRLPLNLVRVFPLTVKAFAVLNVQRLRSAELYDLVTR